MLPQRDSTGREGGQKGCGSKGGKEKEEAQTGGITKHTHTHTQKKKIQQQPFFFSGAPPGACENLRLEDSPVLLLAGD